MPPPNSNNQFSFSILDLHKVKRVDFGILRPDFIVKMSVVKIDNPLIYNQAGLPNPGGLSDRKMGVVERGVKCETCNGDCTDCPGHFGHMELAKPMYHIGFLDYCRKVLSCVCYKCHRLLCDEHDKKFHAAVMKKDPKERLNAIYKLCTTIKKCRTTYTENKNNNIITHPRGGCGETMPKFRRDGLRILIEFLESREDEVDRKRPFRAEETLTIFKGISDNDCVTLGFDPTRARPEWMILTVLPVAPPPVRPSIAMDSTLRQEDDLTFQYTQILKANIQLKKQEESGQAAHVITELEQVLQFFLATLIDNEIPGQPASRHKSGKPLKALRARLKGKEGRLRGNLMGKRVDFSARTVITPDPSLSLDQLGVPRTIALNLTFPEIVTPLNINEMRRLVENGPTEWPGAKYIIRDDGRRIDLRYLKQRSDAHLETGYIVERHIQDEDLVLFNRQPSLHKMSIMGHRVKVLPYSTFRLNLSVTTPYNADFDGDEMNMHVPQSMETKAEIKEIMSVSKQIVSPQANKPVMGIVQDTLVGIKLFTSKDNFIEKDIVMNLLMWVKDFDGKIPEPAILKPKPLWTGKQLISLIIPKVNVSRVSSTFNAELDSPINVTDTRILIENGELLMGILCKRTVGSAPGGLIHVIWKDQGPLMCRDFLSSAQLMVNNWLVFHGFTVGISDTIADKASLNERNKILLEVKDQVKDLVLEAQQGRLECQPGKNMLESFESRVNFLLNQARDKAGQRVQKFLDERNNIKNMVIAGSKGSDLNISQIMACVGQQNVEGKRIPFGFLHRTLPHFCKDDYGPESKGFVENSYLSGLTPQEYFFHSMGGREGLIDTAVKTSETGYIQRRLVKALEDVMVNYDGTVRDSLGHIIQFLYGEDGMAGEYIEDQTLDLFYKNDETMIKNYRILDPQKSTFEKMDHLKEFVEPQIADDLVNNAESQLALSKNFQELVEARDELRYEIFIRGDDKQHLPVNLSRLIWTAKTELSLEKNKISDLNPVEVAEEVDNLLNRLVVVKGNDPISIQAQINGLKLFAINLKTQLAPKKIIFDDKLNRNSFEWLLGEIERRFNQAIVNPGEMVGSIAAQSLGEPATQMTLNTFHFAGVSSKNVTLGVPRLKEVINVAKNIKTPQLTIYLKRKIGRNKNSAKDVLSSIEHTTLSHVVDGVKILYDADPRDTIIAEDKDMVNLYMELFGDEIPSDLYSPWLLRFELNSNKMTDKKLNMSDIENKISERFRDLVNVIASDDNDTRLILRIRMRKSTENTIEDEPFSFLQKFEKFLLNKLSLKGINEIKKVFMREEGRKEFNRQTGDKKDEKENKEWILETDGVNLGSVLSVPGVDAKRTFSNNILEIYKVLGIEAVRQSLLRELRMVLGFYGIYVNYRHLAILCDVMTQRGFLTSITRHGINRMETGPLRKCSFEETVEILLEASVFSKIDYLKGITENIIMGQLSPLGTGFFDVLINIDKLADARVTRNIDGAEEMFVDGLLTPIINPLDRTPYPYTPRETQTPLAEVPGTPFSHMTFSPQPHVSYNTLSPVYAPDSPQYLIGGSSPPYNVNAAGYQNMSTVASPVYAPRSPNTLSGGSHHASQIGSPSYGRAQLSPSYSPSLPGGASPSNYSPVHRMNSPTSPTYSPTNSPRNNIISPAYSPGPKYTNLSPIYTPEDSERSGTPSSVNYSPHSSAGRRTMNYGQEVVSPNYSDQSANSLQYSPNSPVYNIRSSPLYNPTSPAYNINTTSPTYNPTSPAYNPLGPSNNEYLNSGNYSPIPEDEDKESN